VVGVDTNLIVRLLTRDGERQFCQVEKIFKQEQIFIADTVILETEWVLRYAYGFKAKEIGQAFTMLLGLVNVHVNNADKLHRVLSLHRQGVDFADAMHLCASLSCRSFLTFDKAFIHQAKCMTDCPVRLP
jgi:predicted nucleic-acid-binding protein